LADARTGGGVRIDRIVSPRKIAMSMHDWNNYRRQVVAGVGDLAALSPDTVRGYTALSGAGVKTGHLDAKTRELIALAVAVSLRCDGCITVHTDAARKLGVTREELAEALGVAVSLNAGAAIVYATRTLDAFRASQQA
jgi:AhpD family alkylhydroperoxidase